MLSRWWIAAIAFLGIIIVGSIFHFTYEWSGRSKATAWFSSTNESVWEHMKLAVWPHTITTGILYTIDEVRYHKVVGAQRNDVWLSRFLGLMLTLVIIPAIFYAYTRGGKSGRSILAVDIVTFVVAVLAGQFLSAGLRLPATTLTLVLGIALTVILVLIFIVFSYLPPSRRGLFFPYDEQEDSTDDGGGEASDTTTTIPVPSST